MGIGKKLLISVTELARVARATGYSISGLRIALDREAAFRQELILFVVLAPLGIWLGRSGVERALLVGSLVLVMIAELFNSAIEATLDRVSKEPHELAGSAKDIGSAAVFLSIVLAVLTWALVLTDRW